VRFALAVALLVTLGACGDGPSSAERWKDAAKKACDERAESVRVASAQLTADSTAAQFDAWFRQFFEPAYRKQLDAMRAATPPDDEARALVDDTAKVVDAMAENPGKYAIAQDPFIAVDIQWDNYGLTPCGTRSR